MGWRGIGVFLTGVFLMASVSDAEVPKLIRYQGQAVDSKGVPLEGPYDLTFRLYNAETAGTVVWEETQLAVPMAGGHFSVLLGTVSPLTVDWSQSLWLSVQVGTDPELLPRQRITSVPLAIRAEVAESLATSAIPSGAIILWAGASCPAGYTRLSSLDGALIKAGSAFSPPTAAGSAELAPHTHSFSGSTDTTGSHEHNLIVEVDTGGETAIHSINPNQPFANGYNYIDPAGSHSHSVSGTTATAGSATVATLLFCRKG